MESKWSRFFIDKNGNKVLSPVARAFIIAQIILLILVIAVIAWISNEEAPDDDVARYEKIPELTIKDLAKNAPILSQTEVVDIQKKLFKTVSTNTSNIKTDKIEAIIRNDVTHAETFDNKSKYLNMIIDIPSLKQSYEVIYSSNAIIDPNISTFVLCLDENTEVIYENFQCKSSEGANIRHMAIAAYLKLFKYEYFSAYVKTDDPSTIVISPSITYDNDNATKAKYINQVKTSIASLGLYSNNYKFYVRTAKDVNYENKD